MAIILCFVILTHFGCVVGHPLGFFQNQTHHASALIYFTDVCKGS